MLRLVHKNGWVHHDISFGNILIDADGHARLTDFEFAVKFAEEVQFYAVVRLSFGISAYGFTLTRAGLLPLPFLIHFDSPGYTLHISLRN